MFFANGFVPLLVHIIFLRPGRNIQRAMVHFEFQFTTIPSFLAPGTFPNRILRHKQICLLIISQSPNKKKQSPITERDSSIHFRHPIVQLCASLRGQETHFFGFFGPQFLRQKLQKQPLKLGFGHIP